LNVTRARIIGGSVAIIALMVVVGGVTYWAARRPAAPLAQRAPTQEAQDSATTVNVTSAACDPNELTVPAGRVTFAIHNEGARALEWEILNGVMVVDERENIAPGFTQKLTTRLEPGDYDITCGMLSSPKGKLHVAAVAGASARPSQVDLIGPLAEYRVYASYEIDALVDDSKRLADAVRSGDLNAARAAFPATRVHYARLAPTVALFPDLDAAIEASPAARDAQKADAESVGFPRLERDLFARSDVSGLTPVADNLVAAVVALQSRFEDLAVSPDPTIAGAAAVIDKTGPARLNGDTEPYSHADLAGLQANVEGVKKIVDLFQPLIVKADAPLSRALNESLSAIGTTLGGYRNADGLYKPVASLTVDDHAALKNAMKKLASELVSVRTVLGLS
jgi:iron uptake system component EfeO